MVTKGGDEFGSISFGWKESVGEFSVVGGFSLVSCFMIRQYPFK